MTTSSQPTTSFYHEGLQATVCITVRRNARSFRARWKGGVVAVTVPSGASKAHVIDFLAAATPRLTAVRPVSPFAPGKKIQFAEGHIEIVTTDSGNMQIEADCHRDVESGQYRITITIPSGTDFSDPALCDIVNRLILDRTKWIAHLTLIPEAKAIADEIGKQPMGWNISHGHRVLGSCNSRGIINLSHIILFLPPHLRRYIICHELAHLSEMNHSPQFHDLLDRYCGGKERQLTSELKQFIWPIIR